MPFAGGVGIVNVPSVGVGVGVAVELGSGAGVRVTGIIEGRGIVRVTWEITPCGTWDTALSDDEQDTTVTNALSASTHNSKIIPRLGRFVFIDIFLTCLHRCDTRRLEITCATIRNLPAQVRAKPTLVGFGFLSRRISFGNTRRLEIACTTTRNLLAQVCAQPTPVGFGFLSRRICSATSGD
jgi:hypothetical protein